MLVFIDESGDPGINSTNEIFVLALVKFKNRQDAQIMDREISGLKKKLSISDEFHFSKCPQPLKEQFFSCIYGKKFTHKIGCGFQPKIKNPHLRRNPKKFYFYFLRRLLQGANIHNAKIVIDGRNSPKFIKSLKKYLNNHQTGQVSKLEMKDSHKDNLVQLADMVAGAIARAYTTKPNKTNKWLNKLDIANKNICIFGQ